MASTMAVTTARWSRVARTGMVPHPPAPGGSGARGSPRARASSSAAPSARRPARWFRCSETATRKCQPRAGDQTISVAPAWARICATLGRSFIGEEERAALVGRCRSQYHGTRIGRRAVDRGQTHAAEGVGARPRRRAPAQARRKALDFGDSIGCAMVGGRPGDADWPNQASRHKAGRGHIADAGAVGEQHHQPVDADAAAAGGQHAVYSSARMKSAWQYIASSSPASLFGHLGGRSARPGLRDRSTPRKPLAISRPVMNSSKRSVISGLRSDAGPSRLRLDGDSRR